MFKLERRTWAPEIACQSIVVGHTSGCLRVDDDADGINRDDDRDGGGGYARGHTGRWSCIGWSDERPTLAEVTAGGALGLKAFTAGYNVEKVGSICGFPKVQYGTYIQ